MVEFTTDKSRGRQNCFAASQIEPKANKIIGL